MSAILSLRKCTPIASLAFSVFHGFRTIQRCLSPLILGKDIPTNGRMFRQALTFGSFSRSSGFATVIISGLVSEIAQTLVTIGVDLTTDEDGRDIQRRFDEIERLPGNQISHVSA